jgi:hypothetical protein
MQAGYKTFEIGKWAVRIKTLEDFGRDTLYQLLDTLSVSSY